MGFSPVEASKTISKKYFRYLNTSFNIGEPYSKEFQELLKDNISLAKGPYLDITDTFKSGKTIKELIDEHLLPKSFSRINLNQTRPLYLHQEKALRKVAEKQKNIVVSTGTGSGKTESFLIPILRELVCEFEAGTLTPGVRALLIYPMNALANDQIERLREILNDFPEITYGVYTGQTRYTHDEAVSVYKSLNDNKVPKENELISREDMIATPPHIFITNYAMLEYLMVRPTENVFFEGEFANNWKFIVFDEAHIYSGSTGIEVSMLFRRLKAKIGNEDIRYILTSATLGDKEDDDLVVEFAHNLCNAPFEAEDVIRAERVIPVCNGELIKYPPSFYEEIADLLDSGVSDIEIIEKFGFDKETSVEENLYEKILLDANYWRIRELLISPNTVNNIIKDLGWNEHQISSFVQVASLSEKNGVKLFDARYHMFLRATDSAFVTLNPDNRIMLERQNFSLNEDTGELFKVFEAATCIYCNSVYLVGKTENDKLEQMSSVDNIEAKEIYLLSDSINDTDEDHTLQDEGINTGKYKICPLCGHIRKANGSSVCEHGSESEITVYKLTLSKNGFVTKCPKCENVNGSGILRQLYSGQEAATSVIGTALFEELPSYEAEKTSVEQKIDSFDEFGVFGADEPEKQMKKLAKQFITFSDSRQAAAFYATFLKATYNNILCKRIIVEALKKLSSERCFAPEFVDRVQNEFEKYDVDLNGTGTSLEYGQKKEATKAILRELVENNNKTSLYSMGLLPLEIDVKGSYQSYNIDCSEFRSLCSVFALSMFADAAINYDSDLNRNDIEAFTHNGIQYSYTISDSTGKYTKSFMPTRSGLSNKRIDYLRRIIERKSMSDSTLVVPDNDELAAILGRLWNAIFINQNIVGLNGNGYRVNFDKIILRKNKDWYICDKCNQLTCHNIENVCPSYKCDGHLRPINPDEIFKDNHYFRLYQDLDIRNLNVVEHTAQLDRNTAYEYQNEFKKKHIDVLSCSTTFEMGVDVGSLETVFMRNMPPSPSNYAQRAGRAGRSKKSSAFALTFCNKASHDFSYFRDPVSMIKGKINPPKYVVDNDRIGIRHLYAATLGFFWRLHPEFFGKTSQFIGESYGGENGFLCLKKYVESQPSNLKEYLLSFLPHSLSKKYEVETYGWKDRLVGENGVLTTAIESYKNDVDKLKAQLETLSKEVKNNGEVIQRIRNYNSEPIISFMSRNGILPKYGFPVDTVEMLVNKDRSGLQLSRDLSMAISEYAPGSQIVANGNLITSRYIRKIPKIGWKKYSYVRCPVCKTLNMQVYLEGRSDIPVCSQCGNVFGETRETKTNTFLIPEWGFIAESKIKTPGLRKPMRTYSGEISYVGLEGGANLESDAEPENNLEENEYMVFNSKVVIKCSHNDEMAIINRNPFYVCNQCGYAELGEEGGGIFKDKKKNHADPNGYKCSCEKLERYSLGYTFKTDVIILDFPDHKIDDWKKGISILYALLRGICLYLNIGEDDISGCLQMLNGGYSIVIFDNTPGGAGHAKRLNNIDNLRGIIRKALSVVANCTCGGTEGDSSCYFCLRNYRNQRHHDDLKRKYAVEFFESLM